MPPDIQSIATPAMKAASAALYTGATTALIGGLTVNELMTIGGFILAVIGFGCDRYYKHKQHKAYMQRIANTSLANLTNNDG